MKEFSWDKMKTLRDYQWNGSVLERSWTEEMNSHQRATWSMRHKVMKGHNEFINKLSQIDVNQFNIDIEWKLKIFILQCLSNRLKRIMKTEINSNPIQ